MCNGVKELFTKIFHCYYSQKYFIVIIQKIFHCYYSKNISLLLFKKKGGVMCAKGARPRPEGPHVGGTVGSLLSLLSLRFCVFMSHSRYLRVLPPIFFSDDTVSFGGSFSCAFSSFSFLSFSCLSI